MPQFVPPTFFSLHSQSGWPRSIYPPLIKVLWTSGTRGSPRCLLDRNGVMAADSQDSIPTLPSHANSQRSPNAIHGRGVLREKGALQHEQYSTRVTVAVAQGRHVFCLAASDIRKSEP